MYNKLTVNLIDVIDQKNQEIRPEDGEVYTKMEDLADELPDSSPRFILLSYPLTLVSVHSKVLPFALINQLMAEIRSPFGSLRTSVLASRELQP